MSQNDQKILERIRNLLKLAEDGNNDEESQTAILLAQKLMLKHRISQGDLEEKQTVEIVTRSLSVYKRIYWWEKLLSEVIADNFRVMYYMQSNQLPHRSTVQRKIVFMGYQEDVDFAYEMFNLAAESMKYYARIHVSGQANQRVQASMRKEYYRGFIAGLEEKFKSQQEALKAESEKYALMVQVPGEVEAEFNKKVLKTVGFTTPAMDYNSQAYQAGFQQGQSLSLNHRAIEATEE